MSPEIRSAQGAPPPQPAPPKPPLVAPVPNWKAHISSGQGHRESPGGVGSTEHPGIDIAVPQGTPIQAVKEGKVVHAGPAGGYGNLVVVAHPDGTFTKYAHCSEIHVQVGQAVEAGAVVAKVGSTGNSTGPHLHFEVRRGSPEGELLDAAAYLEGSVEVAAGPAGPNLVGGGGGPGGDSAPTARGPASGLGLPPSGGGSGGGAAPSSPEAPAQLGPSSAPPSGGRAVPAGNFTALLARLQGLGISREWLEELARRFGVPLEVILAVMMQESGGNPNARSPVGAMGLMQLMPATAAGLGVGDPSDPKQNLEGGVKYLAQQLQAFGGDITKALAAYNAGPGNVQKYGGVPPFSETRTYVANISASLDSAKQALA